MDLGPLGKKRFPVVLAVLEELSRTRELLIQTAQTGLANVTRTRRSRHRSLQLRAICRVHIITWQAAFQLLSDRFLDALAPDRASVAACERQLCRRALSS